MEKTFITFHSSEDLNLWTNYQQGLRNALERYGVAQVVLGKKVQDTASDAYVILSRDQNGKILGGIRLQIRDGSNRIPLEKIENTLSHRVLKKIFTQLEANYQLAEICGLWVSVGAHGQGLGEGLALEATQLGIKLGVDILVSMLPAHTLNYFLKLGYQVDPDLPPMAYPDDRYLSTVVWYHLPRVQKVYEKNELKI